MGAAFVPTVLFTALIGCGGAYDVQDCDPEVESFISASLNYMDQHREEMQSEMECVFPDLSISSDELVDAAMNAAYLCSSDIEQDGIDAGALAKIKDNEIIIDVSEEQFQDDLALFKEGQWTEDKTMGELKFIASLSYEKTDQIIDYYRVVSIFMGLLAHEIAHIELEMKHSDKTTETVLGLQSGEATWDELSYSDEVYAWGTSALMVGLDSTDRIEDFLKSEPGSKKPIVEF